MRGQEEETGEGNLNFIAQMHKASHQGQRQLSFRGHTQQHSSIQRRRGSVFLSQVFLYLSQQKINIIYSWHIFSACSCCNESPPSFKLTVILTAHVTRRKSQTQFCCCQHHEPQLSLHYKALKQVEEKLTSPLMPNGCVQTQLLNIPPSIILNISLTIRVATDLIQAKPKHPTHLFTSYSCSHFHVNFSLWQPDCSLGRAHASTTFQTVCCGIDIRDLYISVALISMVVVYRISSNKGPGLYFLHDTLAPALKRGRRLFTQPHLRRRH